MPIDDILNERAQAQTAQQSTNQSQPQNSNATIQIDLGEMSRDDIEFWLMVVQTLALVYIALNL